MTQPEQKPFRSKQNYGTPENFLTATKRRLGISAFAFDFAADAFNHKADSSDPSRKNWWNERDDSLSRTSVLWAQQVRGGWGWLNPPFTTIGPWARRCSETKLDGGQVAFLVPAAVGANWFRDHVDGHALVLLLNGRLAFMPDKPTWLYPKDCVLCLYSPSIEPGYEVWDWRKSFTQRVIADVDAAVKRQFNTGIPRIPNVWENATIAAGRSDGSWADDICQNDRDCQCASCRR